MKKIAALTMVRNDEFFLRKWVEYYGRELGKENLYIYYDGEDQVIADFCQGTNVSRHPKIGTQVVAAEKARLKFLSEKAAELFAKGYDLIIGVDADEYIVVDPYLGVSLREFLSTQDIDRSVRACVQIRQDVIVFPDHRYKSYICIWSGLFRDTPLRVTYSPARSSCLYTSSLF